MANWTVSQSSIATTQGATVSTSVVLTITPNVGYVISASNFKIGGASNTSGNIWAGGNVDIGVNTVTFADTGTAGTASNTVTATVAFDSFTMPSSDKTLYIDIDEVAAVTEEQRPVCIRTYHTLEQDAAAVDKHTVTTTSGTGITQSNNLSSVSTVLQAQGSAVLQHVHQGTVPEGIAAPGSLIMTKTFATNTINGYFYLATPSYSFNSNVSNYSSYYTVTTSGQTYDANSNLTGVTFKLYYTPPVGVPGLDPDPGTSSNQMCELSHALTFTHTLRQTPGTEPGSSLLIKSISCDNSFISSAGEIRNFIVSGNPNAEFILDIISSDSSKTYDFSTDTFTAGDTDSGTITIGGGGVHMFSITYPSTSSNLNYNFIVTPVAPTTALGVVPTSSGQFVLYQYAPIVVTLGLDDSANVYDDGELFDGSPNTAVTITGEAGTEFSKPIRRSFSYTIQPDMITAGSGSLAPKGTISSDLDNVAELITKIDGTSTTTSIDVDTTVGVTAGASFSWDSVIRYTINAISGSEISVSRGGTIETPSDEPPEDVLPPNHNDLCVGMFVEGTGIPKETTITDLNSTQIGLSNEVNIRAKSKVTFTPQGITVSSVTDSNTLVLSQTIPFITDDLDVYIGSPGAGTSSSFVDGLTVTQSSTNVIIAGTFEVNSFGTQPETIKLDLDNLITIS